MFNNDIQPAQERLMDAIQFRQKGGNYWYPDILVDRDAIALTKVRYRPAKSEDEILAQFSGVAFCQFNTPPLGRNSELKATITILQNRRAVLEAETLTPKARQELAEIAGLLEELEFHPTADILDKAADLSNYLRLYSSVAKQ